MEELNKRGVKLSYIKILMENEPARTGKRMEGLAGFGGHRRRTGKCDK
jgi:hypothetical protein